MLARMLLCTLLVMGDQPLSLGQLHLSLSPVPKTGPDESQRRSPIPLLVRMLLVLKH